MTYEDIATYTALAFCAGFLVGAGFGAFTGFVRALIHF